VANVSGTAVMNVAVLVLTKGDLNFSGGTINVSFANGISSHLNWTGGTFNFTSNVTFDAVNSAPFNSTNIFGDSLTLGINQTLKVSANETLGDRGIFALTLNSGGSHHVTGNLTLNPTGTITQNSGSNLYAATFTHAGGAVNGTLQNQGNFIYQSGAFNGRLLNQGTVSFGSTLILGNGLQNETAITISTGQTLTANGAGIDNLGSFILDGGTLSGAGPITNNFGGTLEARGTINPALTNYGVLTLTGVLRLNNATAPVNNGTINGTGTIIGNFTNSAGGTLNVAPTANFAVTSPWTNAGVVTMQGAGGILGGGAITNTTTIEGAGTINAIVLNNGILRSSNGQLHLTAAGNTNTASAQIQAFTGSTIFFNQGLATNAGLIALSGGTFDNNNHPLTNTGYIEGAGILRTSTLTNAAAGIINLADAPTSVFGTVTNNGNINITSNTATFFGNVTNVGTIKVTNGIARFLGNGVSMTVGGTYISDPSDNFFHGLAITSSGSVIGGVGDRFFLTLNSPFTNAGSYNNQGSLAAAAVTNTGTFAQPAGTITATQFNQNAGTLAIGGSLTTTALAFNGGTLVLNLTAPGIIEVTGANALALNAAAIQIASTPTGEPSLGFYEIINHNGFTGSLANITLPTVTNNIKYLLDSTDPDTLRIHRGFLGDANDDGIVNFSDFIILSQNFGQPGGWDKANFLGTATVDFSNFIVLSQHFGQTIGSSDLTITPEELAEFHAASLSFFAGTGIPEPTSLSLLAISTLTLVTRRKIRTS
jgi:hypothetical protein